MNSTLTPARGGFFMPSDRIWGSGCACGPMSCARSRTRGCTGIAENPYNLRRFKRVRRIAAELFATQDARDGDAIEQIFSADPWHLAPYPCGDAAIFNARGEILLIQRADDQLWAMPGGAFEVGETPAEGACREAWEETGVAVEPLALVGVYDSRLCGTKIARAPVPVCVSVPPARS